MNTLRGEAGLHAMETIIVIHATCELWTYRRSGGGFRSELVYQTSIPTEAVKRELFTHTEGYYNRQRLDSALYASCQGKPSKSRLSPVSPKLQESPLGIDTKRRARRPDHESH
jgi:hypothetical protein